MSKRFYQLTDMLPVFVRTAEREEESTEVSSSWLQDLKNVGDTGEKDVKAFLETTYDARVEKMKDSAGYDFKVTIGTRVIAVEVKATTAVHNRFFLSINELTKSKELMHQYYIFFVKYSADGTEMYIIKNPYYSLKINDIEHQFEIMRTEKCIIDIMEICISLENCLNEFQRVIL